MRGKLSTIASCAKIAPFITLIAFLAACSRDSRAADIKQCVAQIEREASEGQLNNLLSATDSVEERHDKIGRAVSDCMGKAGYSHANRDMADERCVDDVDFSPYCYQRH